MRIQGSGPRRNPKTPSEFRLQYAGQGRASARHSDCAVVPRRRRAAGQEHRHCSLKSPEHLTEDHRAGEQSALRHQITSAPNSRVANALAACSAYGTPDRKPHSKSAPDLSLPTAGCIWRRRRSGSKSARSTQRETTGQLFNLHRAPQIGCGICLRDLGDHNTKRMPHCTFGHHSWLASDHDNVPEQYFGTLASASDHILGTEV